MPVTPSEIPKCPVQIWHISGHVWASLTKQMLNLGHNFIFSWFSICKKNKLFKSLSLGDTDNQRILQFNLLRAFLALALVSAGTSAQSYGKQRR